MTNTCPKCGATIVVETDDRKYLEKWIEKCDKELKAFNQELEEMVKRLA